MGSHETHPCLTVIGRGREENKKINQSTSSRKRVGNHLLWIIYWQRNLWQAAFFHDAQCDHIRRDLERFLRIACEHSYHILLLWFPFDLWIISKSQRDGLKVYSAPTIRWSIDEIFVQGRKRKKIFFVRTLLALQIFSPRKTANFAGEIYSFKGSFGGDAMCANDVICLCSWHYCDCLTCDCETRQQTTFTRKKVLNFQSELIETNDIICRAHLSKVWTFSESWKVGNKMNLLDYNFSKAFKL